MQVEGSNILVTGANRGLGKALVEAFLKGGAAKVYAGVPDPLTAEDIADCVAWVAARPAHVNIDRMTVRPRAQAAQHKVHRVL